MEGKSYQELLPGLSWGVVEILEPWFIVLTLIFVSLFMLELGRNLMHGIVFRLKGFRPLRQVKVKGQHAVITRIGVWSTHFEVESDGEPGTKVKEYLAVSNARLDFLDVSLLVWHAPKGGDHIHIHHHGKPEEKNDDP